MPANRAYVDPSDIPGVIADFNSAQNGLTAATTQTQAAGTPITKAISRFATVANAGDAATLPAARVGDTRIVINAGANSMGVFPASGDKVNALSANAVYAVAAAKTVMFVCAVNGTWNTILTA